MANTIIDINNDVSVFSDGKDDIVVTRVLADIPGGVGLDTEGFSEPFIRKGHIIVKDTESNRYKPLGVQLGKYVTLQEKHEYVGVSGDSVLSSRPIVGVITSGQVNAVASPYPVTSEIVAGLPRIEFLYFKAEAVTEEEDI